jgi:hypothetical protein
LTSAILYNLYPVNHWREVTLDLLSKVSHDSVFICVSLSRLDALFRKRKIHSFLKTIPKVKRVLFVTNNKNLGEVVGFDQLRNCIKDSDFNVVTYLHSKGVTKPGNKNIRDWVGLMKYFLIDRHTDCISVFQKGYILYGVNLGAYDGVSDRFGPFRFSDFHYSGNFVSVNLDLIKDKFFATTCDADYFGVEGFWGKLTTQEKAFCAHLSSLKISNHYSEPYPEIYYRNDHAVGF